MMDTSDTLQTVTTTTTTTTSLERRLRAVVEDVVRRQLHFLRVPAIRAAVQEHMIRDLQKQIMANEDRMRKIEQQGLEERFWKRLRDRLNTNLPRMLAQPGDCVGVLCAQSIGERQTQLTLNSFHSAGLGVDTVVTGVPRFLELLNATRDLRTTTTQFRLSSEEPPMAMRCRMTSAVVHTTWRHLLRRAVTECVPSAQRWWWPLSLVRRRDKDGNVQDDVVVTQTPDLRAACTLVMDRRRVYQNRLASRQLADSLMARFSDIEVLYAPRWVCEITVLFPPAVAATHLPNVHRFVRDTFLPRLLDLRVCGIAGVTHLSVRKDHHQTLLMEARGACLRELAAHPCVSFASLRTNDMWDVYDLMGIEGTRQFLLDEFTKIMSDDGSFVHPSHVQLLIDIMTRHGTITSISRYGMKKESAGPLSRASFEEVMDHFLTASVFQEEEDLSGVSASIICGKRAKIGTGLCDLLMKLPIPSSSSS